MPPWPLNDPFAIAALVVLFAAAVAVREQKSGGRDDG